MEIKLELEDTKDGYTRRIFILGPDDLTSEEVDRVKAVLYATVKVKHQ